MAIQDKGIVPSKVEKSEPERVYAGFFKIDRYRVRYERFDNAMSAEQVLEVAERGDAVSVLIVDADQDDVLLVEQFRLPTLVRGGSGWITELAAGMIRERESPSDCLRREVLEEVGYQVTELHQIAKFFVSPGGSTEQIYLYYAEVRVPDLKGKGGGILNEGENIRTVRMPLEEFFSKLENGSFEDAKLIIAGQWLKAERAKHPAEKSDKTTRTFNFRMKHTGKRTKSADQIIGYKTGSITAITDVDVWVNPTDTDMILDSFRSRSVSAAIRYHGAEKYDGPDKRIKRDTIAGALRDGLVGVEYVKPTTVIETTSGALAATNNVKRILHVAVVPGAIGTGLEKRQETLERCIEEVLDYIERRNWGFLPQTPNYTSVLFPILGTGPGGFFNRDVIPRLVRRAIDYAKAHPRAGIRRIYFCGYTNSDKDLLEQELSAAAELERC